MPFDPGNSEDALPAAGRKNHSVMLKLMIFISVAVAVGIMIIVDHRDSVNNALDTGNCLVEEGVHDFFATLKAFLHQTYRWIFKTGGNMTPWRIFVSAAKNEAGHDDLLITTPHYT